MIKQTCKQEFKIDKETVNERFENWNILNTPYHHNLLEHHTVFGVITVLTQLSFKYTSLFQVEYDD
jgi:hypothetical protein